MLLTCSGLGREIKIYMEREKEREGGTESKREKIEEKIVGKRKRKKKIGNSNDIG